MGWEGKGRETGRRAGLPARRSTSTSSYEKVGEERDRGEGKQDRTGQEGRQGCQLGDVTEKGRRAAGLTSRR